MADQHENDDELKKGPGDPRSYEPREEGDPAEERREEGQQLDPARRA